MTSTHMLIPVANIGASHTATSITPWPTRPSRRSGRSPAWGWRGDGGHPGDTVYTPPGEWHWHGATPENFMTHLAMWEGLDSDQGSENDWGAPVTDVEYGQR